MQPYKICPRCGLPAALETPVCAKCGRAYQTYYPPPEVTQVVMPGMVHAQPAPQVQPVASLSRYRLAMAIGGALLLAAGTFAPLVRMPIMGTLNFIRGDGTIVLGLSLFALLLAVMRFWVGVGIIGAVSLLLISRTLGNVLGALQHSKIEMLRVAIGIEWGWLLLVVGANVLLVAALAEKIDRQQWRQIAPVICGTLGLCLAIHFYSRAQHAPKETPAAAHSDSKPVWLTPIDGSRPIFVPPVDPPQTVLPDSRRRGFSRGQPDAQPRQDNRKAFDL